MVTHNGHLRQPHRRRAPRDPQCPRQQHARAGERPLTSRIPRRSFLWLLLALAPAGAEQPQRSAKEYIKTLEDPHRVERLKPAEVIRTLALKPGDVVADIGSGSGLFRWSSGSEIRIQHDAVTGLA